MHTALKSFVAAAAAVVSLAAAAQPVAARLDLGDIEQRQARQERRIERAVAHGDLSRRELRMLRRDQREIARVKAQALADGHLSRREQRQLATLLDQTDAHIRQLRHQLG